MLPPGERLPDQLHLFNRPTYDLSVSFIRKREDRKTGWRGLGFMSFLERPIDVLVRSAGGCEWLLPTKAFPMRLFPSNTLTSHLLRSAIRIECRYWWTRALPSVIPGRSHA